jgi:glycosyltransferase involved in cell wall biosynthesis
MIRAATIVSLGVVTGMLSLVVWNVAAWPAVTRRRDPEAGSVSVLIPARNEAGGIEACLESVVRQGAVVREILVYDDGSSDGTAGVVRAFLVENDRVRLLAGGHLPAGWCGKPHACLRLAEAAVAEWLLFLDADARLADGAVERLLRDARDRHVTLLSAWPALELVGFWERLLMPVLNLVVFSLYPAPLALLRGDPSLGLAHGACILAHRPTYGRLGGHALVRDQLFEDSRLAQAWRARGQQSLCLDGQTVVSVRMYRTAREIWAGFQKNCYPAFRHEGTFWAFLALHTAAFLVPPAVMVASPSAGAAAAFGGGMLMRAVLSVRFGHPMWSAVLQPVSAAVLVALGLASRRRYRAAQGVEWKGRRYGPRGEVAP